MWPKRAGRWASSRRPALFTMFDVLPFSLHGPDVLPFWQLTRRPALLVKGQDVEGAPEIPKGQHVGHVAKRAAR